MGLFNRTIVVPAPPDIEAKAETGIGAVWMSTETPLSVLRKSPQAMMKQAQAAYHENAWVRAAERLISGKFATVSWHLEDENDDEVGDESPANLRAIRDLIEQPKANLDALARYQQPRSRRELWALTSRHLGLCGTAFWFLDQIDGLGGVPLGLLYLNPALMYPSSDKAGNVTGWVFNPTNPYTGQGGVALRLKEVLCFYLDPADSGPFGIGLVESAWAKMELTRLADRQTAQVLANGGRIPGVISPHEGILTDDQYQSVMRELRNISESTDVAKRTMVLRGAVDFTKTALNPQELDLLGFSKLSREDILALWNVPESMIGIRGPAGLGDGGERGKAAEATLWQNAIEPRLTAFAETLQYGLLDRYKAFGISVELEIEPPTFDDEAPRFDNVQKTLNQPLTNDERRALIGLAPLDAAIYGDLGTMIYLPGTLVSVDATPVPPSPPVAPPLIFPVGKASIGLRPAVDRRFRPAIQRVLAKFLAEQGKELRQRVKDHTEHILRKPSDDTGWWDQKYWDERLAKVLRPHLASIAETVIDRAREVFAPAKADPFTEDLLARILASVGLRITGINRTTRDEVLGEIRGALAGGLDEGLGAAELGARIETAMADLTTFSEYRSEMIARTESGTVLNQTAIGAYGQLGAGEVDVIDGDGDNICAEANGSRWTLAEAESNPLGHPNCTRDFLPVLRGA